MVGCISSLCSFSLAIGGVSAKPTSGTSADLPISRPAPRLGRVAFKSASSGCRRVSGSFGAIADAELRENPADVMARRLLADEERLPDSRVGHPPRHEEQNPAFASRQFAADVCAGCRAGAEVA